jgi:hypothetical protein
LVCVVVNPPSTITSFSVMLRLRSSLAVSGSSVFYEDTLLPDTVAELKRLGISPKEVALDGGFNVGPTSEAFEDLAPDRVFISGRQQPGSKRTQRRLQKYRTGAEGRITVQTRLRNGPIPPQRRRRPADLERMGDPGLQR